MKITPPSTNGRGPDHADGVGIENMPFGYPLAALPDVITVDFESGEIPHREGILDTCTRYVAVAERARDPLAQKKRHAGQYMADFAGKMYVPSTGNKDFVYGVSVLDMVDIEDVADTLGSLLVPDITHTLREEGVIIIDAHATREIVAQQLGKQYSFFRDSASFFSALSNLQSTRQADQRDLRNLTRRAHEVYFSLRVLEQHAILARIETGVDNLSEGIIRTKINAIEDVFGIDRTGVDVFNLNNTAQAKLESEIDTGIGTNRKRNEVILEAVHGSKNTILEGSIADRWITTYGHMVGEIDGKLTEGEVGDHGTALTVSIPEVRVETIDMFPTEKQIEAEFPDDKEAAVKMARYFRSLVISRLYREQRIASGIHESERRDIDPQNALFVGPSGSGKTNGIFHDIAKRFGIDVYVDEFNDWMVAGFKGKQKGMFMYDLIDRVQKDHPEMTYQQAVAHIESGKVLWMLNEVHKLFKESEGTGRRGDLRPDPEAIQTDLLTIAEPSNNFITPTAPDGQAYTAKAQEITGLKVNTRNLPIVLAFDPKPELLTKVRGRAVSELGVRNAPIDPYVALEAMDGRKAGEILGLQNNLANRIPKILIERPPTLEKFVSNLHAPVEQNPRSNGFALRQGLAIACRIVDRTGMAQPNNVILDEGVFEVIAEIAYARGADWRSLQDVVAILTSELTSAVQNEPYKYTMTNGQLFFSVDTIRSVFSRN